MDLTVHIGAHRTGSTLVAQAITGTVQARPDCGVAVWHPKYLRGIAGFQAVPRLMNEAGEPVSERARITLSGTKTKLAEIAEQEKARGVRHLVMSEENLMGTMRRNMVNASFYRDVKQRLQAYAMVLPQVPTRVALGVRDYGAVWASAFHYIPQSGKAAPSRAAARRAMLGHTRGWTDVAQDIYEVWPDVEIFMWQQEDLADHGAAICASFLGLDPAQIVMPERPVNTLRDKAGSTPLFSDDERQMLSQRYAEHIALLRGHEAQAASKALA